MALRFWFEINRFDPNWKVFINFKKKLKFRKIFIEKNIFRTTFPAKNWLNNSETHSQKLFVNHKYSILWTQKIHHLKFFCSKSRTFLYLYYVLLPLPPHWRNSDNKFIFDKTNSDFWIFFGFLLVLKISSQNKKFSVIS